jgi:hypothetical protein
MGRGREKAQEGQDEYAFRQPVGVHFLSAFRLLIQAWLTYTRFCSFQPTVPMTPSLLS